MVDRSFLRLLAVHRKEERPGDAYVSASISVHRLRVQCLLSLPIANVRKGKQKKDSLLEHTKFSGIWITSVEYFLQTFPESHCLPGRGACISA